MADNSLGAKTGVPVVVPNIGPWTAYTPTFAGLGTVTGISVFYRDVGDSIEIFGRWLNGTPSASVATISLPNGDTANTTSLLTAATDYEMGRWELFANSNPQVKTGIFIFNSSTATNALAFGYDNYSSAVNPATAQAGNAITPAGAAMTIRVTVPVTRLIGRASLAYGAGLATSVKSGLVSYEERTTHMSTFSGPFATTASTAVQVERTGKKVTLSFPSIQPSGNSTAAPITMTTALPAAYRPTTAIRLFVPAVTAGADQTTPGMMVVDTAGVVTIYLNNSVVNFPAQTSAVGIASTSVTYLVG